MANENERKHDPAENREREMGHRFDDAKTGGAEKNVGQADTAAEPKSGESDVLTGDGQSDDNFGGRTGSGTSAMAANNSHADLGAAGPAGYAGIESGGTPGAFVGSEAEDSGDYLQEGRDEPNQGGFAEQGRGAPEGAGPEGSAERTANLDSDVEGSSRSDQGGDDGR